MRFNEKGISECGLADFVRYLGLGIMQIIHYVKNIFTCLSESSNEISAILFRGNNVTIGYPVTDEN